LIAIDFFDSTHSLSDFTSLRTTHRGVIMHIRTTFISAAVGLACLLSNAEETNIYTPDHSFGPASEPIPDGARLAGRNEFENRYRDRSLVLQSQKIFEDLARQFSDQSERSLSILHREMAESRPDLQRRLSQLPNQLDLVRSNLVLVGKPSLTLELAWVLEAQSSSANLFEFQKFLRSRLDRAVHLPPLLAANSRAEELSAVNEALLETLNTHQGREQPLRPTATPPECDLEAGSDSSSIGLLSDQSGARCEASPSGLQRQTAWPLKNLLTCVKNQGRRGTASAFAITALYETLAARDLRTYNNYSEQHLFSQAKLKWARGPSDNSDSGFALFTERLKSANNYRFHYEDLWTYNPAPHRSMPGFWQSQFEDSCEEYNGRHCSDFNHQARRLCAVVGDFRYCGFDTPMPAPTNQQVQGSAAIFDPRSPDRGLEVAKILLRAANPLVLTTLVSASFLKVAKDGLLVPSAADERPEGGHHLLLVGWLPNRALPTGVRPASGNGYFIAKNSWGTCHADSGFIYLSEDYVRTNAINILVMY